MFRHVELKPSSGMQATQHTLRADITWLGQVVSVLFRYGGFTTRKLSYVIFSFRVRRLYGQIRFGRNSLKPYA